MTALAVLVCVGSAPAQAPRPGAPSATQPAKAPLRTKTEVRALIDQAGRTAPDWWNSVPLNYPPTLDLTWRKVDNKWNNQRVLGQYLWDIINQNPGRWREGVKLLHHVVKVNQDDPYRLDQSMDALARLYAECLEDYARGAYWYEQVDDVELNLARCYWKLGGKEMAAEILRKYGDDDTGHGDVIKLWADMGELDTALRVADVKARKDTNPDSAYLAAGDACRLFGRYPQALAYYQKVLTVTRTTGLIKRNKQRAQASIVAIKLFDALDLRRVPDGAYRNSSIGYEAQVHIEVVMKAGRVESVKVTQHKEKQFYSSINDTTRQIVQKQGVKGIEATSGATITSEAIINATAKALSGAMRP